MSVWIHQLLDALRAEESYARAELESGLALPAEDRVAVGVSWPLLRVEEVDRPPWGGAILTLRAPRGAVLHDGIDTGEPVHVRWAGGAIEGFVRSRDLRTAEVRLRDAIEVEGVVEVCRRFDPTSWRRYRASLRDAVERDSPLVRALLEPDSGAASPQGPTSGVGFEGLDPSQAVAASHALEADALALIHGPPGTGKTHTVTKLVEALVERGERPLALADSNAAVDHLTACLAERRLNVVRLGLPARIGEAARQLSLDVLVEHGPYGPALVNLRTQIRRLRQSSDRQWRALLRELRELEATATDHVIGSAQVLCCTLGSLARFTERLGPRRTAVVDEATQAIEPAIWAAVPMVERLVLVGDPKQLGPVVRQPGNILGRSLFERLLDGGATARQLDVQRRMHLAIQSLVQTVYGDSYRPHPSVAGHRLADLPGVSSHALTEAPVRFIDTSGAGLDDARDPVTCSTYNSGELRLVEAVVGQLLAAGLPANDIGVITPYSAQVQRLAHLGVEVATVNAFQGRQKEAIVCSFVRSNLDGDIGFVADRRRLTVAITRACRAWIGIGDLATLCMQPAFADLADRVADIGVLDSVWVEPWASALSGL